MAGNDYQDASREEKEPLNGEDDGSTRQGWRGIRGEMDGVFATSRTSFRQKLLNSRWIWIVHGALLSLSVLFFAASLHVRSSTPRIPFTYSPAQSAIRYEIQHFDLPPVPEGPFVGKGPEVDAMWDYITDSVPDTMISRDEMLAMGLDPEGALEITDPDTGKRGYRVAIEVFHQLHCLNLLRQKNYKSYYEQFGGDVAAEKHDLSGHIDHCIDALRQFVMCQGDVNVFAFRFPFNDGDPWPDYTTPHVCRNYDDIRRWAMDHMVRQGPDEPDH